MTKQIPESRIAINPVVIDDSKRGLPPENNIPQDMDSLLAWLKDRALEAHHKEGVCFSVGLKSAGYQRGGEHRAYNRVIEKIENSRVSQRPHVPRGWDYV